MGRQHQHKISTTRALQQNQRIQFQAAGSDLAGENCVRILRATGQNLFECTDITGRVVLCELSRKLRNVIWLKRGMWVVVEKYENQNIKVMGVIQRTLEAAEIEDLTRQGIIPQPDISKNSDQDDLRDEDSGSESDLPENTNRRAVYSYSDEDSDEE